MVPTVMAKSPTWSSPGEVTHHAESGGPVQHLEIKLLHENPFSRELYGDPELEIDPAHPQADGLLESIADRGLLTPLLVTDQGQGCYLLLSGHRRLACARRLGWSTIPCLIRRIGHPHDQRRIVLESNHARQKRFSQRMREADALEVLIRAEARNRQRANLKQFIPDLANNPPERRNSDTRHNPARGRTDQQIARLIGLGGKDLYRQARAVWNAAGTGDHRAQRAVDRIDVGEQTIYAAFKDLRRKQNFSENFRPNPYDVWNVRHDRGLGIPHPGDIPAQIVAQAVHYTTEPGDLVVDPMAGGGVALDVCGEMGRRCLAYDLSPQRPEILQHDVLQGLPHQTDGCALIFCDPPYHSMLRGAYDRPGVETLDFPGWLRFLDHLATEAIQRLKPGGYLALLLANQTEKDLPEGWGYLDHAFLGYSALMRVGFLPWRRVSCPMSGGYHPTQVTAAREQRRMLGLVRDLILVRKPHPDQFASSCPLGSPPASS